MMRRASFGSKPSCPILASPMSGLLSAMMISPEGIQFSLNFCLVEVDGGNFQTSEFVGKFRLVQAGQFRRLAQRELPDLEEDALAILLRLAFIYVAPKRLSRTLSPP